MWVFSLSSGKFGVDFSETFTGETGQRKGEASRTCVQGKFPILGSNRAFRSEILGRKKKKKQPFPLVLKVFARCLTDTWCFKRFEGNWLCLLPGYLGCFHFRNHLLS